MIAIDTNIVVRYLTGDHPDQSSRARKIIDGEVTFVTVMVMLETEWVLRSTYGYARLDVVRALRAFCGLPNIRIENTGAVAAAFDLTEQGMDFADALHLTNAVHCDAFVTFDRKLTKLALVAGYESVRDA